MNSSVWLIAFVLLTTTACRDKTQIVPAQFAGCAGVATGRICLLGPDRQLKIWVPRPPDAVRGASLNVQQPRSGGYLLKLTVAANAHYVDVLVGADQHRIAVSEAIEEPEFTAARAQGMVLRKKGDFTGALKQLALAEAQAKTLSSRVRSTLLRAWITIEIGDYTAATTILESVPNLQALWPLGEAYRQIHWAVLVRDLGNYRAALRSYGKSESLTQRLDLPLAHHLTQHRGLLMSRLGRHTEAQKVLTHLAGSTKSPCLRVEVLTALGWVGLVDPSRPPVAHTLRKALHLLQTECPTMGLILRGDLLVNLALVELRAGHLDAASARLVEAQPLPLDPDARAWHLDLSGRLALARGEMTIAMTHFQQLQAVAIASSTPELQWRAAVGIGRALEATEQIDDAIEAYQQAENALLDESLAVPADAGRLRFLDDRSYSSQRLISLLIKQGHLVAAMAAARRARRRVILGVSGADRVGHLPPAKQQAWRAAYSRYREARNALNKVAENDWRASAHELAAQQTRRRSQIEQVRAYLDDTLAILGQTETQGPLRSVAADELLIIFSPSPDGWLRFEFSTIGINVTHLGQLTTLDPPGAWLRELHPLKGQRPVFLTQGDASAIDFLYHLPNAVWSLDLPPRPLRPFNDHAVIVADPQDDLVAARRESAMINAALHHAGWHVKSLQSSKAGVHAVRGHLANIGLLHYAGHGIFAGPEGWQSALRLNDGELTMGDVLTLSPAPRWVVLSGCETGRVATSTQTEGLGLAHAFIAAGTEIAIATSRPVRDAEALTLMTTFYQDLASGPIAALQRAQAIVRKTHSTDDWAAFRILVP